MELADNTDRQYTHTCVESVSVLYTVPNWHTLSLTVGRHFPRSPVLQIYIKAEAVFDKHQSSVSIQIGNMKFVIVFAICALFVVAQTTALSQGESYLKHVNYLCSY